MCKKILGTCGLIVPALLAALAMSASAATVTLPSHGETPVDVLTDATPFETAIAERSGRRKRGEARTGDGEGRRGCKKKKRNGEARDDAGDAEDGQQRKRKRRRGRRGRRNRQAGDAE